MKTARGAVLPKPVVATLRYNHCVFAAMKTARGAVLPKPVVASLRFHSAASPSRERHMIRSRSASPPSRQRHRIVGADAPGGPRDECPSLFKYAHRNAMKVSLNLYTQCFHVLNFMFHLQSSALLNKEGLRPSGRRGVGPYDYNHCGFAAMKTARGAVLPKPVCHFAPFESPPPRGGDVTK